MFNWLYDLVFSCGGVIQIILFMIFLCVGLVALIYGADVFVSGAKDVAYKLNVSPLIIGLTIVSFGTSAPETAVSISSALSGSSDLSISNVVGSNIFNLLCVLGVSAIFCKISIKRAILKRDIPIMIISSIFVLFFCIFVSIGEYELVRYEGIILLIMFLGYLMLSLFKAKNVSESENVGCNKNIILCFILLLLGLLLVIIGGDFVTFGAKNLALKLGMSEALVGLTIVSVGTSLPELITSVVASRRGENEIAIGNVVGSNIFNILFILGASITIKDMNVINNVLIDIVIMNVLFISFFIFSYIKKDLSRRTGIIMCIIYLVYLAYIIMRDFMF